MLKFENKEFRNLEEQVGYLTDAFHSGKLIDELGIKVLGVFPDLATAKNTIRPPYEYGDAFEIGTTKPYSLYIYTRNIEDFFDFGPFPAPGPQGKLGPTPSISINANVTNTTGIPEAIVTKTGTDESPIFTFTFKNIKGERGQTGMQGIQGPKGNTGATGPIGPQGIQGNKGDTGPAFKLLGNLTSTSQLPTPTAELQSQGAAYIIPNTEGIKHIWVIQGTDNLLWTDIGVSGVQGPKGENGIGINDLQSVQDIGAPSVTYNTTNGITINNTERYIYSTGQTDVNTERKIPLIASEGISIDVNEGSDKILIKSLSSNIENGTGNVLIQTTDSNQSFKVMTDGRAKVQSAPTEDNDVVRKLELDKKLTKPTNPSADSAITILTDGTVGTKPLSELGGGKIYLHRIDMTTTWENFNNSTYNVHLELYETSSTQYTLNNFIAKLKNKGMFNCSAGELSIEYRAISFEDESGKVYISLHDIPFPMNTARTDAINNGVFIDSFSDNVMEV